MSLDNVGCSFTSRFTCAVFIRLSGSWYALSDAFSLIAFNKSLVGDEISLILSITKILSRRFALNRLVTFVFKTVVQLSVIYSCFKDWMWLPTNEFPMRAWYKCKRSRFGNHSLNDVRSCFKSLREILKFWTLVNVFWNCSKCFDKIIILKSFV